MIALQITSTKNFMNHLLVADTFDPFLLEEATISTALTVTIDGHGSYVHNPDLHAASYIR